jgi:hypothetical protein
MSLRRTMAVAWLLLAAALPAPAQTTLAWKFNKGDKFYIQTATEIRQKVTIGDKVTSSTATYTTVSLFEVKKAEADSYTLEQTVESVQLKSDKPDDPNNAIPSRFAAQIKGSKFQITLSPSGTIKSLEGYDDFIRKLSGGREADDKALRAEYSEEGIRSELNSIFVPFPEKAVSKGDTWSRKVVLPTPFGTLTADRTCIYEGRDKDAESIKVSEKWSYALPKDSGAGTKITKGDVKVDEASGQILVDPGAGRVVRNEEKRHLVGKLTLTDSANKDVATEFDTNVTRTIRWVKENPLK